MEENFTDQYELLWIRHGESEGNKNEQAYADEGDPNVGLTDKGWKQAIAAGKFLREHYQTQDIEEWPLFVVGDFKRHQQTLAGILHGMGSDCFEEAPRIHTESRLNEQSFGVLPFMAGKDGEFETLSMEYSKQVRDKNPYSASALHGESRRFTEALIKDYIDGTLRRDMLEQGEDRIVHVTSGSVINAFRKSWFHLPMQAWDEGLIQTPNNCDVQRLNGKPRDWGMHKIYDGPSAQPLKQPQDLIAGMSRLTHDSLPQIPDHILDDPDLDGPELEHNDL